MTSITATLALAISRGKPKIPDKAAQKIIDRRTEELRRDLSADRMRSAVPRPDVSPESARDPGGVSLEREDVRVDIGYRRRGRVG